MDWSWRVRHVAVQQLMKVCQVKQGECMKDGLQNAAWTALLSHHSTECDRRVLEAYKIARVSCRILLLIKPVMSACFIMKRKIEKSFSKMKCIISAFLIRLRQIWIVTKAPSKQIRHCFQEYRQTLQLFMSHQLWMNTMQMRPS